MEDAQMRPRPVDPPRHQPAPLPGKESTLVSMGWKDVTLTVFGTEEQITLPVMVHAKVWDVKCVLAEMLGLADPASIDFVHKVGPSYKKHRNQDQINTKLLVKGIKGFGKAVFEWNHPFCIIGAGCMGLRQAIQYQRAKVDYVEFERKSEVGGNAWIGIANRTSKLQTEGPHYQLQYDAYDGGVQNLLPVEKYGYWPSRDEILQHLRDVAQEWGICAHLRLSTEVTNMTIIKEPPSTTKAPDIRDRYYELTWRRMRTLEEEVAEQGQEPSELEQGTFRCSCICVYPGCLVVPHRKTWPGEDVFGGQIGYGFSGEFDYSRVKGERAIIIGMGAFAHENVRTFVEHGGDKVYNIVRRFNLILPRVVCWWVNQSAASQPTAAMVLRSMEPMYSLLGWDPWSFAAVTHNADRSVATIKQYTRWGVSDVYFLSVYFGKTEVIHGEVKRFLPRGAAITNGQVLRDVDHVIKVIGFDGDFGVDRLMNCKTHVGPWPDGDFRRCVISDQSEIDASRFGNIALSPPCAMYTHMTLWYHQHPQDARRVLESGLLPTNKPEPELGSPAYHYSPRVGTAWVVVLATFSPELMAFQVANTAFKQVSMLHLADAERFTKACEEDWYQYCRMFQAQGIDKPWPEYPLPAAKAKELQAQLEELRQQDAEASEKRAAKLGGGVDLAQLASQGVCEPGTSLSFEPAKAVLRARMQKQAPASDEQERLAWLAEGRAVVEALAGKQGPRFGASVPAVEQEARGRLADLVAGA